MIDYYKYIKSRKWKKLANRLKKEQPYCSECRSKENLAVHHLTYERLGNELDEDLTVLCDDCHKETHGITKEKKMTEIERKYAESKKIKKEAILLNLIIANKMAALAKFEEALSNGEGFLDEDTISSVKKSIEEIKSNGNLNICEGENLSDFDSPFVEEIKNGVTYLKPNRLKEK